MAGQKYYYFHIILNFETIFMIITFVLVQFHNEHKFVFIFNRRDPWCKGDNTGYKPKNLSYGKPLTCESLKLKTIHKCSLPL